MYAQVCKLRTDLAPEPLEWVSIEICKPNSKPFLVATWYPPPGSHMQLFGALETFVGKTDCEDKELYILGDINCDQLAEMSDNAKSMLNDICDAYELSQVITEPTRVTPTTRTLIDLVLRNSPKKVVCSGVVRVGISDHDLIYAFCRISIAPNVGHQFVSFRQLKNFNPNKFKADLEKVPWFLLQEYENNPEAIWEKWKTDLKVVDKHAQRCLRRVCRRQSPWINQQLLSKMRQRDHQKSVAANTNEELDWSLVTKCLETT